MRINGRLMLVSVLVSTGALSGCALTNKTIQLKYEPVVAASAGGSSPVAITTLGDRRPNRLLVGEVRNMELKKTADVLVGEEGAVAAWVTDALRSEMQRAGFAVTRAVDPRQAAAGAVVTGDVVEFFQATDADFFSRCTLRVAIKVAKEGGIVLEQEYMGKGEKKAEWSTPREEVATMALQDLMRRAVPDMIRALR
jgi:hypothetical protein